MRALTPLGWAITLGVVLFLLLSVGAGLGVRWDPFGREQRRLERAEALATSAAGQAAVRDLEADGAAEQLQRLDRYQQQQIVTTRMTGAAVEKARTDEDAEQYLEAGRADRLRAHDRELCGLAPDLGGCAGTADIAAGGDTPV